MPGRLLLMSALGLSLLACSRALAPATGAGMNTTITGTVVERLDGTPCNRSGQVVWSSYQRPYGEVLERTVVDLLSGREDAGGVRWMHRVSRH